VRINKTLTVGLVALLLMSMVMMGVNEVPVTRLCVDIPCWTWNRFVANVNVTDVQNLYSFEFKLAWNKTLLDLIGVNITSPEEWNTNYVIFRNETMQNYNGTHGRYWLNMSALAPAPSFNGSTILVKLTFDVIYWLHVYPEHILAHLDLYDTKLNDPEGSPIPHETHDGLYLIPPFCPCTPWLEVKPDYYEATTLGENFTINVYVDMFPQFFFTDWKAKLGYNTTLLDVIEVEEGSFLARFREEGERYFTASINEEEGYVNVTGGILSMCDVPAGSGSLAKVTFNATYLARCSEDGTCLLNLYDTNLTSNWESPISHYVYDGFYQAPRAELTGDMNGDGIVDIQDIVICALAFGSAAEDNPETPWDETLNWNPNADLNNDELVDIVDLVIIAIHFGETC
jgi:hypothetical protein